MWHSWLAYFIVCVFVSSGDSYNSWRATGPRNLHSLRNFMGPTHSHYYYYILFIIMNINVCYTMCHIHNMSRSRLWYESDTHYKKLRVTQNFGYAHSVNHVRCTHFKRNLTKLYYIYFKKKMSQNYFAHSFANNLLFPM